MRNAARVCRGLRATARRTGAGGTSLVVPGRTRRPLLPLLRRRRLCQRAQRRVVRNRSSRDGRQGQARRGLAQSTSGPLPRRQAKPRSTSRAASRSTHDCETTPAWPRRLPWWCWATSTRSRSGTLRRTVATRWPDSTRSRAEHDERPATSAMPPPTSTMRRSWSRRSPQSSRRFRRARSSTPHSAAAGTAQRSSTHVTTSTCSGSTRTPMHWMPRRLGPVRLRRSNPDQSPSLRSVRRGARRPRSRSGQRSALRPRGLVTAARSGRPRLLVSP